jgi:hypothetical protein
VSARIISGLGNALGGRPRRVERYAVKLLHEYPQTELKLTLSNKPNQALVGHRVEVLLKTHKQDQPEGEPQTLISDRNGTVAVPIIENHPLVWVNVRSGSALLAKAPLVPGVRSSETFKLTDDSMRLAVESELSLLKSRIVDAVARRIAHLIRAGALADQDKWDEARAEREAFNKVPGINQFLQDLNAIRIPAVEAANRAKNIGARKRIDKLCNEAADLINRHLSDQPLAERLADIDAVLEKMPKSVTPKPEAPKSEAPKAEPSKAQPPQPAPAAAPAK